MNVPLLLLLGSFVSSVLTRAATPLRCLTFNYQNCTSNKVEECYVINTCSADINTCYSVYAYQNGSVKIAITGCYNPVALLDKNDCRQASCADNIYITPSNFYFCCCRGNLCNVNRTDLGPYEHRRIIVRHSRVHPTAPTTLKFETVANKSGESSPSWMIILVTSTGIAGLMLLLVAVFYFHKVITSKARGDEVDVNVNVPIVL